jgi:RNA polymerase sigma-70 factor (ECF subfamily)
VSSHERSWGSSAPDASLSTSLSLVDRVKARDPVAWARFATLYGPLIYHWCRRSGLQAADAADVVQEVLGGVASRIDGFDHSSPDSTFRGWLWTITRNKICDHFRRRQNRPDPEGGTTAYVRLNETPDPPAESSPQDDEGVLWHGLLDLVRAEFEERTWRAFWRVTVDEQSAADVADELGMSVDAVYQAKSRVLRRLRQQSDGLLD